jgi:TetR/AcrR family transcriptional regulator, fatty acid metabolism regulator protein
MEYTDRQIEIIQAATKLIGDKGLQNLTTKNLAAEMEFSEPALYRHFKGKTEILKSVLLHYRSNLQKGIKGIVSSEITGLEKLDKIIHFQFEHFTINPAIVMVIFAEASFQYEESLSDMVLSILNQKRTMVESIIKSGQTDGSIRTDMEASILVSFYMGAMRFTILRWRLNDYNFDLIKEGKVLSEGVHKIMTN